MGYRKLDNVLFYDALPPGADPSYEIDTPSALWYLGMAGEIASDIKISRITLPMLSKTSYDWKVKFKALLIEAISLKPQRHVDNFQEAWLNFSTYYYDGGELEPNVWFGSTETKKSLRKQVKYGTTGHYLHNSHYDVDRRGIELDLPYKVIAIVPHPEYIGVLCSNEDFFNLFFIYDNIQVYKLRDLKIDDA